MRADPDRDKPVFPGTQLAFENAFSGTVSCLKFISR